MFTRKQTCGVCGYRATPTKEEIYIAEEPRAFVDAAISQKHEYNRTRPYRHGGKKC